MASHNLNLDTEKWSTTATPSINWDTWVEPLDEIPHEPNVRRRSQCEGDSSAYSAFWKSRHDWDLVDYYLYLIAIERENRDWGARLSKGCLIESNGSRWDNLGHAIDSDDLDYQTGWKDPLVLFASLPVPHATQCPDRRIVLGVNLRTHCLVGYLFESAPESIAELKSVWDERELIMKVTIKRFIHILKYAINKDPALVRKGIFNYFREFSRRLHVGMDAVLIIKYIQFLRDSLCFVRLSATCGVGEDLPAFLEMEEYLRDFLCRESASGWMSWHAGITTDEMRKRMLVQNSSSGIFIDQLFPSEIINHEGRRSHSIRAKVETDMSSLMQCEVDMPQSGRTSLEKIRKSTSDIMILLGIFCMECSNLVGDEEDVEVGRWVEEIIKRRFHPHQQRIFQWWRCGY